MKTEYRITQNGSFTFFAESRHQVRHRIFWKKWTDWIYIRGTARGTLEQCREELRNRVNPPPKKVPQYIYHDAGISD